MGKKLAPGHQRGSVYGIIKGRRTSIIEMYAIDVKTTIFPSVGNFQIIDFHKILEQSNRRKELLILCNIPYLWAHSLYPFLGTYKHTQFCFLFFTFCFCFRFLVLICNYFLLCLSSFVTLTQNTQCMFLCNSDSILDFSSILTEMITDLWTMIKSLD